MERRCVMVWAGFFKRGILWMKTASSLVLVFGDLTTLGRNALFKFDFTQQYTKCSVECLLFETQPSNYLFIFVKYFVDSMNKLISCTNYKTSIICYCYLLTRCLPRQELFKGFKRFHLRIPWFYYIPDDGPKN